MKRTFALITDRDDVPVPHFGVCLTVPDFHALAAKLKSAGVKFVIEARALHLPLVYPLASSLSFPPPVATPAVQGPARRAVDDVLQGPL